MNAHETETLLNILDASEDRVELLYKTPEYSDRTGTISAREAISVVKTLETLLPVMGWDSIEYHVIRNEDALGRAEFYA